MLDVALVRDADVVGDLPDHQAVAAHEAEHSGQHLIAARAVVAIDANDLVRFGSRSSWTAMAQAHHVLGEFGLAFDAADPLRDHEGLEALARQSTQYVDGRNVGVALGPAGVLVAGED